VAGFFWAKYAGKKYADDYQPDLVGGPAASDPLPSFGTLPSPGRAFMPIILPIALIALKSVYLLDPANAHAGWVSAFIRFIGEPVTALFVGILLVLPLLGHGEHGGLHGGTRSAGHGEHGGLHGGTRSVTQNQPETQHSKPETQNPDHGEHGGLHGGTRSVTQNEPETQNPKPKTQNITLNHILEASIEKSGPILAIIAMGGAFGEVIKALDLGKVYGSALTAGGWSIAVPFLLAVLFKTAQGSSTVAVMSAAAIVEPMVVPLGLDGEWGRLLSLMAMGAGSMMLSHANDAYFWVIARFAHLDTGLTLRTYSVASALLGGVTFLTILLLFLIL
jgi:H+/gluconate symporter-like permease